MDQTPRSPPPRPSGTALAASCALLALVIALAAFLIAWVFSGSLSPAMFASAALGGGVCWLAAALALTTTFFGNRLKLPVQGMLVAMIFRMGLPLAAVILLRTMDDQPTVSIATTTILGTYMIALVTETALALRMIAPRPQAIKAAAIGRGN